MTANQRRVLAKVLRLWLHEDCAWYRAAHQGERVTLASLHAQQLLTRRAWRLGKSPADNAFEYAPTEMVLDTWAEIRAR